MERVRTRPGTRGWVVGRAAGAPVVISPGWVVAAIVLTVLTAPTIRALAPQTGSRAYLVAAVAVLLLFGSVFLHELAHALVARRRGVVVHEIAVTLLGGHTQFGAAAPTPATSALVAVVGPVVNLLIAAAAWLALQAIPDGTLAALLVGALAVVNALVGVFNLFPGLPLDGGRVLEALIWRLTGRRSSGTLVAGWVGRVVALGVMVWAVLPPLLDGAAPDLGRVAWAALIGAFLWSGAAGSIKAARTEKAVETVTVAGLMTPAVGVPFDGTLGDLRPDDGREIVLLAPDRRPAAYLDRAAVASVPEHARVTTPLTSVAVPLPVGSTVAVDLSGSDAIRAVAGVARFAPVMVAVGPAGDVAGLLRAQDVISALRA